MNRRRRPPARRLSPARGRGLLRLFALLAALVLLIALISSSGGGSGSSKNSGRGSGSAPARLVPVAHTAPKPLAAPISGEAVVPAPGALLVIGGLDSSSASTSGVFRLDAGSGRLTPAGALAEPLHDAAAAVLGGRTLVFGGGSTATVDSVESVSPKATGRVVGHLPTPRSDLSVVTARGGAYVLGGYDGRTSLGPVLQTTDGQRYSTVTNLPSPVRYTAAAAIGDTIYAFGGEPAGGGESSQIQAVDLRDRRARVIGQLPEPISHASAVLLGSRVYVLGGTAHGKATDRIFAFDPRSRRASIAGRLPQPVTNAAAAAVGSVGYLVGGLGAGGAPLASVIEVRLAPPGR